MKRFLQNLEEALEAPELPEKDEWDDTWEENTDVIFVAHDEDVSYAHIELLEFIEKFGPVLKIEHRYQVTTSDPASFVSYDIRLPSWVKWVNSNLRKGKRIDRFYVEMQNSTYEALDTHINQSRFIMPSEDVGIYIGII